jgi:hypothetical protein
VLTREQILSAKEKPIGTVEIKEWGGEVGIRALSPQELVDMRSLLEIDKADTQQVLDSFCRTVTALVVDADGNRLFADDEAPQLRSRGLPFLTRIVEQGKRLNGIGKEDVEAIEKNSVAGQT